MPGSLLRRQGQPKPGRECHHCKQWIASGEVHDCWTTTERALTRDLPENLRDAWERLRETASGFGEQRIYASGTAIMFSRKACYFFVRPKKSYLELCIFLGREVKAPQVRHSDHSSKSKIFHLIQIRHRDEVEPPVTEWLREAYDFCAASAAKAGTRQKNADRPNVAPKARKKLKSKKAHRV